MVHDTALCEKEKTYEKAVYRGDCRGVCTTMELAQCLLSIMHVRVGARE